MTSNTELVKHRFANELIRCCGSHFKNIPSNEQFARDFFLSSKYQLKVSREAVRKWFKGETFPDLDYFIHLLEWLKLDITKIFYEEVSIDPKIPLHFQSLNIEGINQITPEQIDVFVLLLTEIKKNNIQKN